MSIKNGTNYKNYIKHFSTYKGILHYYSLCTKHQPNSICIAFYFHFHHPTFTFTFSQNSLKQTETTIHIFIYQRTNIFLVELNFKIKYLTLCYCSELIFGELTSHKTKT